MPAPPSDSGGDPGHRLHRCIRDLAALNALPSMCIGRTPEEALDVVLDALPTALGCELIYLSAGVGSRQERATLRGAPASDEVLSVLRRAALEPGADGIVDLPGAGRLWCFAAPLPSVAGGHFLAGRAMPLDPETDRVLMRCAANLVGTALETAQVLDAARRKDEFLAMLGHELRNPLAPILTAVELLALQPGAAREQQIIEKHTRHLARLVDDLLDISRVTRGHVELRNESVTLASVLERAKELASALVTRHRHTLHMQPGGEVTLQGDPVRLAQIFANLLTNAAKFTPPGGTIRVTVEPTPGHVRVIVADTGRGIAPRHLARIFEPFVQADRPRDALQGGLGLGLAIVENLVGRHGGTISVHSEGEGKGAAFTVEIPTVEPVSEAAAEPVSAAPKSRAGVRVLVVDDDVDLAELLSESLRMQGFQTGVAHDAREALAAWLTFVPHAAVFDVGLPELDGYDLARAVRAQHGAVPTLIAATGYGQSRDRLRAADAGFDCHFVKPVSVHDLVRTIDERVLLTPS